MMRLARALALAGLGSRRKCEEYIRNGAVAVNGEVVQEMGTQVDPELDALAFHGKTLRFEKFVYYLLFKPEGYTTTAEDSHAKHTVYELLPPQLMAGSRQPKQGRIRVFPVGRLDRNSSGLLLFTNDGDFAHELTHPSFGIEKWYEVRLDRAMDPRDSKRLLDGVRLEDGPARAEKIKTLSRRVCCIMIREGRKREVRRMLEAVGYEVIRLCRISFGPFRLGHLRPGAGRFIGKDEIFAIKRSLAGPGSGFKSGAKKSAHVSGPLSSSEPQADNASL